MAKVDTRRRPGYKAKHLFRSTSEGPVRVIGIDPGSRSLGYGIVEDRRGLVAHVAHGVIRASADARLEHRLREIFSQLCAAVLLYRPDSAAIEGVFAFRNLRSALVLGHARGVALLVAAQNGLSVHEYAPSRVKRSVGASGASGKDAVARMVNWFLQIPQLESGDATDALAVAICHLNHSRLDRARPHGSSRAECETSMDQRLAPSYRRFEVRGG